ncbi:unnamed protein product [Angiostrongylus costaricensis]|uniref:Uncharacterized protein n=1 Tax=Angiostrongylus costaricensis TaxID=334426 RepID=A0A0R3P9J1_ANGCS|nr:unnamed protein product [Angiostrongylus costaricensis]
MDLVHASWSSSPFMQLHILPLPWLVVVFASLVLFLASRP